MSSEPQFPRRDGMRVDIRNVLGRTAAFLKRSDHDEIGDSFVLEEFVRHLGELGQRFYQGDQNVADEFLQLYNCDEGRKKTTLIQNPPLSNSEPLAGDVGQSTSCRADHEVIYRGNGNLKRGVVRAGFGEFSQRIEVDWSDGTSGSVNPTHENEIIVLVPVTEIPERIAAWLEKHQLRMARRFTCGQEAYRLVSAGEFNPVDVLVEETSCSSLTLLREKGDLVAAGAPSSVEKATTNLRVGERKVPVAELGEIFPLWSKYL